MVRQGTRVARARADSTVSQRAFQANAPALDSATNKHGPAHPASIDTME